MVLTPHEPVTTDDGANGGEVPGTRPSLTETAYLRLKREILENRMPPGFQALEPELAKRLGMSRTPVREAVIRLQEDGLVEVIPRRGMRVLPLSPEDMREIYQILVCVEGEAAALLAARQPAEEELAPLWATVADMEAALERDDLDAWADADNRYHSELVERCGNHRLAAIAMTYQNQAHRVRMLTLRLREKPTKSTADHREQIAAIAAGDAVRARRLYRAHRERAAAELLELLRVYRLHNI